MWFKYGLKAQKLLAQGIALYLSLRPVTVGSGCAAYLRNLNKVIKNHDSNRGMDGEMV